MTFAVRKIAKSLVYAGDKRRKPKLLWMAELLQNHGELSLNDDPVETGQGQLATFKVQ